MMSNGNQKPHRKDTFIEPRDSGADEAQEKQREITFITDAPWKAELADECYELFLEKKILVFDEANRELSYSTHGMKMLDEIQNTCIEGVTYDFITDEGAKYAEGILASLGVEDTSTKR